MKASEYIKRIQELIEVVGDVEMIIERPDGLYEEAQAETQNVVSGPIVQEMEAKTLWNPDYENGDQNVRTFIRVW